MVFLDLPAVSSFFYMGLKKGSPTRCAPVFFATKRALWQSGLALPYGSPVKKFEEKKLSGITKESVLEKISHRP